MSRPKLLHIFSTFNIGGPQTRAIQLMNRWAGTFSHQIVSVSAGERAAASGLSPSLDVEFPAFPSFKEGALPTRISRASRRLRELKPDLVLTYNWGAIEAVLALRVFGGPPVVHHEDGFGPDEVAGQRRRRVLTRRFALRAAHCVIVPSRTLERIARETWRLRAERLRYIPNGVDIALYRDRPATSALPGVPSDGALIVGTVAGLRREKNLPRLVRTFASAARDRKARLVVVGEGAERDAIMAEAQAEGVTDRVHMTGYLPEPHRYVGAFDVFALSSDTEQFPISLIEAMASGCAAACTDVGDIREIVAPENLKFVVAREDEPGLAGALRTLLSDAQVRWASGVANRERAAREFSFEKMAAEYERIYRGAIAGASL